MPRSRIQIPNLQTSVNYAVQVRGVDQDGRRGRWSTVYTLSALDGTPIGENIPISEGGNVSGRIIGNWVDTNDNLNGIIIETENPSRFAAMYNYPGENGRFSVTGTLHTGGNIVGGGNINLTGNVSAVNGIFTTNVSSVTGTFTGDVSANDFITTSTVKSKTDINRLEPSALDAVRSATVYTWRRKGIYALSSDVNISPVVEELPGWATRGDQVSLHSLIGILWKAVQELDIKVDNLSQ